MRLDRWAYLKSGGTFGGIYKDRIGCYSIKTNTYTCYSSDPEAPYAKARHENDGLFYYLNFTLQIFLFPKVAIANQKSFAIPK